MVNLDYIAAESAAAILKDCNREFKKLDSITTSAMNILQEQGIYAMFLWLREKNYSFVSFNLDIFFHSSESPVKIQNKLPTHAACQELTADLKNMFLAKQLIERILTYARHMAKAEKE